MKAIIKGKRYDTETATLVAEWSNGRSRSDFHHVEEYLYKTKKGAWFLHGGGGPLTAYSVPVGNNGSGGSEEIIPFSAADAKEWLEEKGCTSEYEEHFPDSVEDA